MPSDATHRVEKLQGECEQWREIGAKDNPAFTNSWVNYNSATHRTAGFYKDKFNTIHLKGVVKSGSTANSIFTLPEGYRPDLACDFPAAGSSAGGGQGDTNCFILVGSDGTVTPNFSGGGASSWLSLENISFRP